MEDALKARLIGASILVLLAVALLPELLSGPKAPGMATGPGAKGTRTITIDLGGAVAASARSTPRPDVVPASANPAATLPAVKAPTANAAAAAETSEPIDESFEEPAMTVDVPPAKAPATEAAATTATRSPVTQVVTPVPVPAAAVPVPAKVNPPTAATGGFSVQVGAFGSADGARKLVKDLQADGFSAYLLQPAPGKKLHRVRVGPVADRAAVDRLAARLKSRGLPVAVVTDG